MYLEGALESPATSSRRCVSSHSFVAMTKCRKCLSSPTSTARRCVYGQREQLVFLWQYQTLQDASRHCARSGGGRAGQPHADPAVCVLRTHVSQGAPTEGSVPPGIAMSLLYCLIIMRCSSTRWAWSCLAATASTPTSTLSPWLTCSCGICRSPRLSRLIWCLCDVFLTM